MQKAKKREEGKKKKEKTPHHLLSHIATLVKLSCKRDTHPLVYAHTGANVNCLEVKSKVTRIGNMTPRIRKRTIIGDQTYAK